MAMTTWRVFISLGVIREFTQILDFTSVEVCIARALLYISGDQCCVYHH